MSWGHWPYWTLRGGTEIPIRSLLIAAVKTQEFKFVPSNLCVVVLMCGPVPLIAIQIANRELPSHFFWTDLLSYCKTKTANWDINLVPTSRLQPLRDRSMFQPVRGGTLLFFLPLLCSRGGTLSIPLIKIIPVSIPLIKTNHIIFLLIFFTRYIYIYIYIFD